MADRVLSEQELVSAYAVAAFGGRWQDGLRAVEAAVLREIKRRDPVVVTEREARKRERAAWVDCVEFTEHGNNRSDLPWQEWALLECNRRYPLPTVTRPRTVKLSNGATVEGSVGNVLIVSSDGGGGTVGKAAIFSFAKTPADARALADLVEHPTEEVPDEQ